MMYGKEMVAAVKVAGKILREFNNDTVYVPFGTEYSILLKNLHNTRALVTISIDGKDVIRNLVVLANDECEVERSILNGNLQSGNKFKFIERTSKIEQGPRGARVDDGIIRISYQFEKQPAPITRTPYITNPPSWNPPVWDDWHTGRKMYGNYETLNMAAACASYDGDSMSFSNSQVSATGATMAANSILCSASLDSSHAQSQEYAPTKSAGRTLRKLLPSRAEQPANETGITVAGSRSDQVFQSVSAFEVDTATHVMVIHLLGQTEDNTPVSKPVTVKTQIDCPTCGRRNKATSKFCSECGTSLQLF